MVSISQFSWSSIRKSRKGCLCCFQEIANIYTADPPRADSFIGWLQHNGNKRPAAPIPPSGTRAHRKVLESWGQLHLKGSNVESLTFKCLFQLTRIMKPHSKTRLLLWKSSKFCKIKKRLITPLKCLNNEAKGYLNLKYFSMQLHAFQIIILCFRGACFNAPSHLHSFAWS